MSTSLSSLVSISPVWSVWITWPPLCSWWIFFPLGDKKTTKLHLGLSWSVKRSKRYWEFLQITDLRTISSIYATRLVFPVDSGWAGTADSDCDLIAWRRCWNLTMLVWSNRNKCLLQITTSYNSDSRKVEAVTASGECPQLSHWTLMFWVSQYFYLCG